MRQKKYFSPAKEKKFEEGLLRVDACFDRHSLPRKFQMQFLSEDVSLSFGRSSVWEERHLMNKVAVLLSKGIKPLASEPLEAFVERNNEFFEEEA